MPYDAPIGRAREVIEICRMVWRRERLAYQGRYYQLPLEKRAGEVGGGTGLGKPLKLINHPVRERIPIALAAIGPKNVALAAELAESWMPIFYLPEKAGQVWGAAVAEGSAKRDPSLGPLDVIAHARLAIGDDVAGLRDNGGPSWPCTSAGWARGAATSTTTWPAGSATRPRPRRSRTPTWTAARPRPRPWYPRTWLSALR